MNRLLVASVAGAVLVGILVGFLWWGLPTGRLQTELRDARSTVDRLGQQLDELRAENERLQARLKAEQGRLKATESDLRREKETTARLQLLISEGKK